MADIFTKEDAALEGATNVMIDDLASFDGDVGVEQLRTIPGTEDYTDEELTQLWADAQQDGTQGTTATSAAGTAPATATQGSKPTDAPTPAQQRAWKLYGADEKEVADFSKMTVEQFLAAKIGYTANKAEQKKTLDELIRVAQFGHLNEQRQQTSQKERDQLYKELTDIRPKFQTLESREKQLVFALDQYAMGNQDPLKRFVQGYIDARSKAPTEQPSAAAPAASDDSSADGMRVYYETVVPAADALAQQYGVKSDDVRNLIMYFVNNEPAEFITAEKLQQIMEYDVPQYIERQGFGNRAGSAVGTPSTPANELETLKKEIAALKANQQNSTLNDIRSRNRKLPSAANTPSGGRLSDDSRDAGMKDEDLNSAADFRAFLRR